MRIRRATISVSSPAPSKNVSEESTVNNDLLTKGEKVLAGDAKGFDGLESF
jgi:hypothetical protein